MSRFVYLLSNSAHVGIELWLGFSAAEHVSGWCQLHELNATYSLLRSYLHHHLHCWNPSLLFSCAMGAGQSTANDSHPPGRALHVLRVTPSSPASQANIEAFFDFVVGFEGDSLASRKALDAAELERLVESHEGKTLNLVVWNTKNQNRRSKACSYLF